MSKIEKIMLDGYGSYLAMSKGKFIVKDEERNIIAEYPLFESDIGEVLLRSGNLISVGALASLGFWEIDTLILTRKGKPVAYLKGIDDESHVKTRICQYEAYLGNDKGIHIAKEIVLGKLLGQNSVLEKHDLRPHERFKERIENIRSNDLKKMRKKLLGLEGRLTRGYYEKIFQLIPNKLRPEGRKTFHAYDGINNTFNLAYTILKWKCHNALIKAKLEPYLGFLHSVQEEKPSLIMDMIELYRHLIDDFLIQYCQTLKVKDFTTKTESISRRKKGKRQYLTNMKTNKLFRALYDYLESRVEIPRIRHGKSQTIETLINEEALLLASYLRDEKTTWIPRIAYVTELP